MSLAEEMLATMSASDDISTYLAEEEPHIVINESRQAIVPNELKTIAVTGDKDIETVTFDCVRYWDGNDLSTFAIYLNYVLPDLTTGTYIPEKITTTDGDEFYHFDWQIKNNITAKSGKISFAVTAISTKPNLAGTPIVDKQWSSLPNSDCSIVLGLDISNVPSEEESSDVLAQMSAILGQIQEDFDEWLKNNLPISQTTGDSETAVMSQKAVTNTIFEVLKLNTSNKSILDSIGLTRKSIYQGDAFDSTTRVLSDFLIVNKNTRIVAKDGYQVALNIFDFDFNYVDDFPFDYETSKSIIFGELGVVRVIFAKTDHSEITIEEVRENYDIYTDNHIVYSAIDIPFSMGNIYFDQTHAMGITNGTNRIHSGFVRIPKNTKITTSEKFYISVFDRGANINATTGSGWTNEFYTEDEVLIVMVMAENGDGTIEDIDALKSTLNMTVINPKTVANLAEPVFIKSVPCDIVGTLANGIHYSNPTTRAHTDFIKVSKGMSINVDGYKYGVHFYSDATEGSFYKATNWVSPKWLAIDEDCYIRVVCSHYFDGEMTANEANVKLAWYTVKSKAERPFGIVAHRGLTSTATENTIEAFKDAVKAGFKYIETDLWWTSDELPVLNHDGTHGGVAISSLTLAEWKARGLCSLVDFLNVCKINSVTPIIEFKAQMTDARADYLYNLLSGMGMLDVIFLAFNDKNLMHMVNKYPFDIMWARDYGTIPTLANLEQFKKDFMHGNNVYWTLFDTDFNESYYTLFRNSGVKLAYGSANDIETFYRWSPYADMIMTDRLTLPII